MTFSRNRLRLIFLLILLFAALLVGKLYFIQIVSGEDIKAKAEGRYLVKSDYFDRGKIFFSSKDGGLVPAASVKEGFLLSVNPNILGKRTDLDSIYEKLNSIVALDLEVFLSRARKQDDPYEELVRRLSAEQAGKIRVLNIQGVSVAGDRWRVYPGGNTAAHVIGLMGYKGNEYAGRYGLESYYVHTLDRNPDDVFVNFFAEIFSNIKEASGEKALEGDIITTIEPTVQSLVEKEFEAINNHYSSEFTGGIVIDPKTGQIYAMSLTPAFNPNSPQSAPNSSVFKNRLVEDRYEMGSIIKALTVAIGLDEGVITARSTYNDTACMTLNTKTFCNYEAKLYGPGTSIQTALSKSLNLGMASISLRVGAAKFNERLLEFGLGSLTGIDLPNEGKSLVSNLQTSRDLEAAQASFGQGIALTPIGTVRALSALANGGRLVTPHVVKETKYEIGPSKVIHYPLEGEAIIKEETVSEISRMLTEVVDYSLRDGRVRLETHSIAAKTGTAQIANPSGGGYYSDRYLHSFFGYFPSYDPKFLVFLYTYNPRGVNYASETLTDGFMNITKFLISYYNIPPDREAAPPQSR